MEIYNLTQSYYINYSDEWITLEKAKISLCLSGDLKTTFTITSYLLSLNHQRLTLLIKSENNDKTK